ncbi:MAG: hypothetical protein LBR79_00730 [Oscillospiraceae bacterium]|nr:hypothetical protein [Oscillospiraceae bacterium]
MYFLPAVGREKVKKSNAFQTKQLYINQFGPQPKIIYSCFFLKRVI